jgi:hypothetical protein
MSSSFLSAMWNFAKRAGGLALGFEIPSEKTPTGPKGLSGEVAAVEEVAVPA